MYFSKLKQVPVHGKSGNLMLMMLKSKIQDVTSTKASCVPLSSLPQILFPSTDPTITAPSSYTIQIFWPSAFHAMLRTTDLFLLLIISSYQEPSKHKKNICPTSPHYVFGENSGSKVHTGKFV